MVPITGIKGVDKRKKYPLPADISGQLAGVQTSRIKLHTRFSVLYSSMADYNDQKSLKKKNDLKKKKE